jgi:predicted transglutaminase-like cysteine proteinase
MRSANNQSSVQHKRACQAADTKVKSIKLNRMQRQVVESINDSVNGRICFNSETNQQLSRRGKSI